MGASIASLIILATFFTSVFLIYRTTLHGEELVGGAVRGTALLDGERAATAISIGKAEAYSVFRCDTIVETEVTNTGQTMVTDLSQMDVLTWYVTDTGEPVITPFTYTDGNLQKNEWAASGVQPVNFGANWDPGETLAFNWRFLKPQEEGSSGYVTLVTPNGISDSGYVDFVEVSSADCQFLHNDPTPPMGDTASHALLPMEGGLPAVTTLFNYDTDRDVEPGLTILRGQNGLSETLLTKFQTWRTGALSQPMAINGDVLIDLWSALSPVTQGKIGIIIVYLRDFDGATHTEIAVGALFSRDWQSGATGFVERMTLLKDVNYTVPAGHELEVRIQVDIASELDMTFAYDTEKFSSLVNTFFTAPVPSAFYYLHNNPTPPVGDTARQAELPLDGTAPTATVLYDYGVPNNNPGLLLQGTQLGLSESDPSKFQIWKSPVLASPLTIQGDVMVDMWAGIRNFQNNQSGAMTIFLRDYDGAAYTEISNGSVFAEDWQEGSGTFVRQTIIMPDVDYTVPAGHVLEARMIADTIKASKDMWLAYDTTAYPTAIRLP